MTQTQLEKLCRKWQKILRLQDWKISIGFCELREIKVNRYAEIKSNEHHKTATILILREELHPPGHCGEIYSIEKIIVHELIHLHFLCYDENTEEVAINCISEALVKLERKA